MKTVSTTSLFFGIAILLAISTVNSVGESAKTKCEVKEEKGTIIDIKTTKATNKKASVVQGLKNSTEAECKNACCQKDQCNIYIFYKSNNRPVNCFLIDCKPPESCVRKNFSNSVVGVMKKSSIPEPITAKPVTTQQNISSTTTSTTTTTTQLMSTTLHVMHKGTKKIAKEPHNHTNDASLIIALFFGFLFLFAVIILVGRPWVRFLQRPRYSKVDYLMNGL